MKILLDENLPKRLKAELSMFETATVREMGWQGRENGDLIRVMIEQDFSVLLTFDKNMEYQQNFSRYPVSVFLLNAPDNKFVTLRALVPELLLKLREPLTPGVVRIGPA
jgi:predicted nuclease of predicted toxin-antitoxin system